MTFHCARNITRPRALHYIDAVLVSRRNVHLPVTHEASRCQARLATVVLTTAEQARRRTVRDVTRT